MGSADKTKTWEELACNAQGLFGRALFERKPSEDTVKSASKLKLESKQRANIGHVTGVISMWTLYGRQA